MRKYALLLLFLTIGLIGYTQSVFFSGKVVDSLHHVIPFANVMAVNTETSGVAAFAVTDLQGAFRLRLEPNNEYLIKTSYVGYKTFERLLNTGEDAVENVWIKLETSTSYLDAVEVVEEMPVTLSGDTLVYKAEAFTTGRERKLGDVLEKLPGVEVDENGDIKVQGKKVEKLLVEGKPFFGGSSKLATQNLPANAVDKVQVLRDFNEVGPMGGLSTEENLAMNIQLKDDKKNIVFGDVEAGGGPEKRYLGHTNLYYYSRKLNINAIGDLNNIGEQPFTIQDYYRFSGDFSEISSNSGSQISPEDNDLGFPTSNRTTARKLKTKLGAINLNYTPNSKWHHSGFFIGSFTDNTFGSRSQKEYLNDETSSELLTNEQITNSKSLLMKYSATYAPKTETYWKYSILGKLSWQEMTNNRLSAFTGSADNRIMEQSQQTPRSLNQKLAWYHVLNEQNIISWENQYGYAEQDPSLVLSSMDTLFSFLSDEYAPYGWQQTKSTTGSEIKSAFNYYRVVNRTNHINFSLGFHGLHQQFDSHLIGVDENGSSHVSDSSLFINAVDYGVSDYYGSIAFKTKIGDWVLSPALYVHQYKVSDEQSDKTTTDMPIFLAPSVYAKWNLRSSESITFQYALKSGFKDASFRNHGLIVSSYNALYQGNRFLNNNRYHELTIYYNYFNFFDGLNLFGNLNYQRKYDDFVSTVSFVDAERVTGVTNSQAANQVLNGTFQFDKRFMMFRLDAGASVVAVDNHNEVEGRSRLNRTVNQTYEIAASSTFFNVLDMKAGYKHQVNRYTASQVENRFTKYSPFTRLNWEVFKYFTFDTEFKFNAYRNKETGTTSDYSTWDAGLRYQRKSSAWEFALSAYNLLNTNGIRQDSSNESFVSTYEYYIQKRYFLLRIKYSI